MAKGKITFRIDSPPIKFIDTLIEIKSNESVQTIETSIPYEFATGQNCIDGEILFTMGVINNIPLNFFEIRSKGNNTLNGSGSLPVYVSFQIKAAHNVSNDKLSVIFGAFFTFTIKTF